MWDCCSKRAESLYSLRESDRAKLAARLPQLEQNRVMTIAKHILFNFLDLHADYIFVNGTIYTMNQKQQQVQAVAIRGQEIIFAGKSVEVLPFHGQNTVLVDLKGRVMLPGFIDPHIHMCYTMFSHWVDLSPFVNADMDQVRNRILSQIEKCKQNQWIMGQLFDPSIMKGKFELGVKALDALCPKNPLFILQANGHFAHVNSLTLKIAGITKQTPDPPHGRFVRDQDGQLTGQLQEFAVIILKQFIMASGQSYVKNFQNFLDHCASKGCTALHDCGIGLVDPQADLAVLYQVMSKDPPIRFSGYLSSTQWQTWKKLKLTPEWKDPMVRINGMKCWIDGSTQGGTAFVRQPYIKPDWGKGKANYELQVLKKSIKQAHDEGWQVGVHANGDAAIDIVIEAFRQVQEQNPKPELRHRIEHCTLCHKQQLQKMKQINLSPSFLIGHIYYYGHVFQTKILGKERCNLLDPMKTALECGHRVSMHSDYNCQPVDPIRCISNAVNRQTKHDGTVLNQKECLTPYQALKTLTIDAAWQCHLDDIVGSIEVKKKADFVILDRDPNLIPSSQLLNVKVVETWMNGVRRFKTEQKLRTLKSLQSLQSFRSDMSVKSKNSVEQKFSLQKIQSVQQSQQQQKQSQQKEQQKQSKQVQKKQ